MNWTIDRTISFLGWTYHHYFSLHIRPDSWAAATGFAGACLGILAVGVALLLVPSGAAALVRRYWRYLAWLEWVAAAALLAWAVATLYLVGQMLTYFAGFPLW